MTRLTEITKYSSIDQINKDNLLLNRSILEPIKHLTVGELLDSKTPIPGYLGINKFNTNHLAIVHHELQRVFDYTTKIFPIRVDFFLNPTWDNGDITTIKEYYNKLLNNLRHNGKISHGLISIIGKYELGDNNTWHMHCVFFYGARDRLSSSHFYLARDICQYWDTVITNGLGRAYSSNIESIENLRYGIRTTCPDREVLNKLLDRRILGIAIRYYDYIARIKLFNYLAYLCKLPTKRLPLNSRVITVNHVRVFALVKRIRKNESYVLLSSKVEDILYPNTKKVFS